MAKAKLHQIKLASGDNAAQPPFPGGWVLAVFDALRCFASALAATYELPTSQRTKERIKSAKPVRQNNYDKIEGKLIELVTAVFPKVSFVNGFAKKYVNEYFGLWKCAAEIAATWLERLGFMPGESYVLGRALVRDLVLRLCYLESCERRLNKQDFDEDELSFLRHDSPAQVYHGLIHEKARSLDISVEELAGQLGVDDRTLRRIKCGESLPSFRLLLSLKQPDTGHRLLAGVGFVDQLLKNLGLHKSVLRHEFLVIASMFFRNHPIALESFSGTLYKAESGAVCSEASDFERYIAFGDRLLLHPGFECLYPSMPDSLWRAHLYTLQFARIADLTQAYYQFSTEAGDELLEVVLRDAEHESAGCPYRWMDKLRLHKSDLPLPPTKES